MEQGCYDVGVTCTIYSKVHSYWKKIKKKKTNAADNRMNNQKQMERILYDKYVQKHENPVTRVCKAEDVSLDRALFSLTG